MPSSEEFEEVKFEELNQIENLEGSLNSTFDQDSSDDGTLNEPVAETIKRDFNAVLLKFKYVINPTKTVRGISGSSSSNSNNKSMKAPLLYDWDLWGPLLLCTFMATLLQNHNHIETKIINGRQVEFTNESASFTDVFLIIWCGAGIVTLNSQLLGGKISFFQSVCVLGYCILPLTVSLVICKILLFMGSASSTFAVRGITVLTALGWSIFSASSFLGYSQPYGKKALIHYPICLFYVVIAWIVVTHYS